MGRIVGENKHKGTLYPVDSKAIYRVIYEVVAVLPTENIKTSVIYCVPIVGKDHEYDMYLYIDGWSKIGSGSIDLSDYYTKEEVDDKISDISTISFKIVQEKPTEDIDTNVIYLIPKSESETGNIYEEWIYINEKWELLGTTDIDLSGYMSLAPLNPTAEQIAAMPSGQVYTTGQKAVIKTDGQYPYENGQVFYDSLFVYEHLFSVEGESGVLEGVPVLGQRGVDFLDTRNVILWRPYGAYILSGIDFVSMNSHAMNWVKLVTLSVPEINELPTGGRVTQFLDGLVRLDYYIGDKVIVNGKTYECADIEFTNYKLLPFNYTYIWEEVPSYYTKTEINAMIGDIETLLSEV